MSNMSYCRFENTASDLADCLEHIGDDEDEMSEYEKAGKKRLLKLCAQIAEDYGDELNMEEF